MRLSPHFTLDEFTLSQTAVRHGWDNTPPAEALVALTALAALLEHARTILGVPLLLSSGYRSPPLNAAIGGVPTSAHLTGRAADFTAPGFGTPFEVATALAEADLPFDQCIHEYGRWVHLAIAPPVTPPRRQCLSIFPGTGYLPGLRSAPPPLPSG